MGHQRIGDDELAPFIGELSPLPQAKRISACTNVIIAWTLALLFAFISLYLYTVSLECQCSVGLFMKG